LRTRLEEGGIEVTEGAVDAGRGKVTMRLRSGKRLKKATKVIVKVRSAKGKTSSLTVKAM
jgi:hypothetical protein